MNYIVTLPDGGTNTIVADEAFVTEHFPGKWVLAPDQPIEITPPPAPRHISVGAFYDRFDADKWGILASTDPSVVAVIKDASVRKYIDLDNPALPAGIAIIQAAGFAVDPAAVLDAPIQPHELP